MNMKRDAALEHKQPKFLSTAAISREAACKEQEQSAVLCCAGAAAAQCQGHAAVQRGILGATSPGAVTALAGCSPVSAMSTECCRDVWGSP